MGRHAALVEAALYEFFASGGVIELQRVQESQWIRRETMWAHRSVCRQSAAVALQLDWHKVSALSCLPFFTRRRVDRNTTKRTQAAREQGGSAALRRA